MLNENILNFLLIKELQNNKLVVTDYTVLFFGKFNHTHIELSHMKKEMKNKYTKIFIYNIIIK